MRGSPLVQKSIPLGVAAAFLMIGLVFNLSLYYRNFDLSPLERQTQSREQTSVSTPSSPEVGKTLEIVESLERPLFSPTRTMYRPPETPASSETLPPPAALVEMLPPTLRLHGIREIAGVRAGLVSLGPSGNEEWIVQGSSIQGWTISEITRDTLTLSHESQIKSYSLFDQGKEP